MVSVCCITYNHEAFIAQALEGFLMQETRFGFEVIVHDDASTDATQAVIRSYAARDPRIKPILRQTNVKSTGVAIFPLLFEMARGRYIAMCEGDDYWTDPLKLQKQVDVLEADPDIVLSVGGYTVLEADGSRREVVHRKTGHDGNGYRFGYREMQGRWLTKTLTALFRKQVYHAVDLSEYRHTRDIHLFYHLMKGHAGYYHEEVFGVYRVHTGGVNSMRQGLVNNRAAYACYRELHGKNRDPFTRHMRHRHALNLLHYNLFHPYEGNTHLGNMRLFGEALTLSRGWTEFRMLFTALLPEALKTKWKKG